MNKRKYDVIIDTDIGGDIDDTWAVATLLAVPEVRIKLISVTNGNKEYRTKVIAKLLKDVGRADIPIAVGKSYGVDERPLEKDLEGFDLSSYEGKIYPDYRSAYTEIFRQNPEELHLLCLAPFTSLSDVTDVLASKSNLRLIAMAGSIKEGYFGRPYPEPECNIVTDILASRKVLGAGLNMILLPLDVCGQLVMNGADYAAVRQSDALYAGLVRRSYEVWQRDYSGGALKYDIETSSSILYDMVCVWYLLSPINFKITPLPIEVDDRGMTVVGGDVEIYCALGVGKTEKMMTASRRVLCGEEDVDWGDYYFELTLAPQHSNAELFVCECGREKCFPYHKFGPIERHYYILHYVVNGSGFLKTRGKNYKISANECFLIKPGIEAEYGADPSDPWEYYWVGFSGAEAKEIIRRCGLEGEDVIRSSYPERLFRGIKQINENAGKSVAAQYSMLGNLYIMFSDLLSEYSENGLAGETLNPIGAAVKYINENYMREIKIEDLSSQIGFERTYFYKLFTARMGVSPKEYLISLRIDKAKSLIFGSDYTLEQIAGLVGYEDYNSFARIFKKKTGISPKEYRAHPVEMKKVKGVIKDV